MKNLHWVAAVIIATLSLQSFRSPGDKETHKATPEGRLVIHFNNMAGDQPLHLNDTINKYRNAHGDDFIVTTFKYYISNFTLIKTNGDHVALPENYLLVNAADSSTLTQELQAIPAGKYKAISFTIGVDSARNFAGAQTGALDPAKGMFWSWNSGYIFVKLEGVSSRSTAKKSRLTFHIGGAKSPNNTIRTFTQDFDHTLKVKGGQATGLIVSADATALFTGKTDVDFSKLNFTMGGPNSVIVADNYAQGLFKASPTKN